jgi:Tol biopolymer transport system component
VSLATLGTIASLAWLAHAALQTSLATDIVSCVTGGVQANAESMAPAISADGRYVAFVSWSTNLVSGDTNGFGDVFVRDRESGITTRISVASDGTQANGESYEPAISADGRYIAFTSEASNLVAGDTNKQSDVFVHDMATGSTVRASVASDGTAGNGGSRGAAISSDGRYLVFESDASNLVAGDTNQQTDVFLRDLQAGTTERVNLSPSGAEAVGMSLGAVVSDDGRYVAFASTAANLISPPDANGTWDVFVRDRTNATVVRVSVSSSGVEGNGASLAASISADGRFVAFESQATNLVGGDTNGRADVFVRDLIAGTTSRVSVGTAGVQGNAPSTHPSLSSDGRYVTFVSEASNLVTGDTNNMQDVFIYDQQAGATVRVSVDAFGAQAQGASLWPTISRDGRYVAFPCGAALTAGDTNGVADIFVRGPLF